MLAEDHAIVRQGLRAMIEKESDMEVVGEAENGAKALALALTLKPEVIIMDVSMPEMNGIDATRQIKAVLKDTNIIALSVHDKREYVMDMIKEGVSGYLLKDCVSAELIEAIRRVMKNESYLSPRIAAIVLEEHNVKQPPEVILKDQELDVLKLLAEGNSAKEIAKQKNINVKTVEAQRRRIMQKLKIKSFAELIKYAIRQGLTTYV